ncbi:PhzF family phenazine biosynthesis protein [Fructobacillus ficulneus]|uniref:Phenazine biosynthesis protein PhzF family n=1 Tax=Fructobacillus ficulneus TaxID=157463 RepID=A0A0K8MJL3_9LACO|nr:PhzF family phenazine biosynthesis protein [Fructobacillus ficulneus]GAP00055.1 phenazine biosynthesis protein PhzF family [Fructobacillus ficulneus]
MVKSYVVDAFAKEIFKGNPAAVLFIEKFPSDKMMQNIAMENKLSETAFAIKRDSNHYDLRWFSPAGEIDLCGHATLATGFLVYRLDPPADGGPVVFNTISGDLTVTKKGDYYEMNFPTYDLKAVPVTAAMTEAYGLKPDAAYVGRDLLCVFPQGTDIAKMDPDMEKLKKLDGMAQHATAVVDDEYDCVSRSFAPKLGIPEDPVCGSGHCHIAPYWSERLGKKDLKALQASPRSGILHCEYLGDRTKLSGPAVLYSESEVNLAI